MMDILKILEHLPHRYPMLLVDRILELEPGKRCRGIKNVTINEPFFQGHYPGLPIMPGVLLIEALAQAGAMVIMTMPQHANMVPLIGSVDAVKFKKPVVPGDQLVTDAELLWFRNSIGKMKGIGYVDGEVAVSIELIFKMIPREGPQGA